MAKRKTTVPHVKLTQHFIAETDKCICFLSSWAREIWINKDHLRSYKIVNRNLKKEITMWIPEERARKMGLL